jgi:hypothetical protein
MQKVFLSYKRLVRGLLRHELSWKDLEGALFYLDLDRDNVFHSWPPLGTDDFRPYAEFILHFKMHCGEPYGALQRFAEVSAMLQTVLTTARKQGRVCWIRPGATHHSRRSLHRLLRRNGYEPKDNRLKCIT